MPRGGFSSALLEVGVDAEAAKDVPLNAKEQAELLWLRNRVATLEAQLRMNGITPVKASRPPMEVPDAELPVGTVEAELRRFLADCELSQYEDAFSKHGYCDMWTIAGMQESHMRSVGMSPGHALKFWQKIQERKATGGFRDAAGAALEQVADLAPDRIVYRPGVYRCVHGPRVAIRATPSKSGKVMETLRPGDLIRICEIVPPCWAKVDESELWARFTAVFPRKPRVLKQLDADGQLLEDEDIGDEEGPSHPTEAFVLIEGKEVGIDGPLIRRIPVEEANKAVWPFRDALDVRCFELDAASLRRQPHMRENLRKRVVDLAKGYAGTPYAKCYHDPSDPRYLAGSQKIDSPLFLDNRQLIIKVVEDLSGDFGFKLDVNMSCAHLYDLLAEHELRDEKSREPGDLIFYEVASRRSQRPRIVHVEIFVGGPLMSNATVGSAPWSASDRTGGKDGVQMFRDYGMDFWEGEKILGIRCCSIRTWLESDECSFAHGQMVTQQRKSIH